MNKPKYRLLNAKELESLEHEFTLFLSAQGIEARDWEKIKSTDEKSSIQYLVSFSDFIFQDVINNIQYLAKTDSKEINVVHCQKTQSVRLRVTSSNSGLDLTTINLLDRSGYHKSNELSIEMMEKKYETIKREEWIFSMLESGYLITDGQLYKLLCLIMVE